MSRVGYNASQAFRQINRNKGMSIASVFAITAMLLILGLFFVVMVNVNLFTEMVKSDYDQVEVFMKDKTTRDDAQKIIDGMKSVKGVEKAEYRSQEDALKIMKKRWGENGYLLDSLGDNPLPSSVLIQIGGAEDADRVIKAVKKYDTIEDIKYYKETVDKLMKVTTFIKWAALIIMVFLVVVSVVVVSNTIKLTVLARSKEISIMKYIGASNWFIRGPFLLEGISIGAFSSLISALITYLCYSKFLSIIGVKFIAIFASPLVPANYLIGNLVIIFLAIGVSVGACGSVVSMRKFLDA